MIISAWWLRTSNKFKRKEVKRQSENLENVQLLSGRGFVQNKSATVAPREWRICMDQLINQSTTNNKVCVGETIKKWVSINI